MNLREVKLTDDVKGRLYLSGMPGRQHSFEEARRIISSHQIDQVFCLATLEEIKTESPGYFKAISETSLPWFHTPYPIPKRGYPENVVDMLARINQLSAELEKGERILVHSTSGIGRSAVVAICVLLRFGLPQMEASIRVADAGAGLESPEQEILVERMAEAMGSPSSTQ